jgi:homoserine/homoserine lactone efflux protein
MALKDWLSFALLSMTFCLIPGPSVCFTIAHALRHGTPHTLMSIAGQLSSNGLYILAVSAGLDRMLDAGAGLFTLLKLGGVGYLLYMGVVQWRAKPHVLQDEPGDTHERHGAWKGFGRGFVVCGTNPKTFLYYAAILPPFISPARDRMLQLAVLSATTLFVGGAVLLFYALMATRVRAWLDSANRLYLRNRISGGLMIAAALYLAVAR